MKIPWKIRRRASVTQVVVVTTAPDLNTAELAKLVRVELVKQSRRNGDALRWLA